MAADDPSPGGTGAAHCLGGVPLTLRSRYAHSPHPVRVGGRGRGSGRPQANRGGDLLQQQALMTSLFLVLLFFSHASNDMTGIRARTHTSYTGTYMKAEAKITLSFYTMPAELKARRLK